MNLRPTQPSRVAAIAFLLIAAVGLASSTLFALSGYSIDVMNMAEASVPFMQTAVTSSDIASTDVVREPASLLLLGCGLTALATVMRRRRPLDRSSS